MQQPAKLESIQQLISGLEKLCFVYLNGLRQGIGLNSYYAFLQLKMGCHLI